MPPHSPDDFSAEEATLNATHDSVAKSWEALQDAPTDNTAYLLMLVGPNAPRMYPVGRNVSIGRGSASTIAIEDDSVSRNHARIAMLDDGRFVVEDLGSRNGTRINGEQIKEQVLKSGDRVQFGTSSIFLVTYHTRLEDQLLEIRKLESEGRLASGLALNYRSILKPLLQHADAMQEAIDAGDTDRERLKRSLAEVSRAARRAEALSQQLLTFARTGDYREQAVNLSDLLRDTARMIPQPIDRSVKIDSRVDADLMITGDPIQLRTALTHVFDNALDAMPQGGTMRIAATRIALTAEEHAAYPLLREGEIIEVIVTDTGVGMHNEVMRRIFDPFYSTKPTREGSGLGLAIVDRIIKSHRGHVEVSSTIGEGTEFRILFPPAQV